MCRPNWPKTWDRRLKHRGATNEQWRRSDARSSTRKPGRAQYNPQRFRSDDDIKEIELLCVTTGTLISDGANLKSYYLQVDTAEAFVGACSDEFTHYIYAEWQIGGAIHGWPISRTELEKKLRKHGLRL